MHFSYPMSRLLFNFWLVCLGYDLSKIWTRDLNAANLIFSRGQSLCHKHGRPPIGARGDNCPWKKQIYFFTLQYYMLAFNQYYHITDTRMNLRNLTSTTLLWNTRFSALQMYRKDSKLYFLRDF